MSQDREPVVVGVGMTDFADLYRNPDPWRTEYQMGVDALKSALDDSGLNKQEIDGLLLCRIPSYELFGTMTGLASPRVVNTYEGTGRMAGVALQDACALIRAGAADTIALVYGNNGRTAGATYGGADAGGSYDAMGNAALYDLAYGMTSPGAYVGMMYRNYAATYGVEEGALAPIALNSRRNAQMNPVAVMTKPLSHDEYLASRYITDPLRLYDYCMINDGGVAIIVTTAERAKDLRKPPVAVRASASQGDLTAHYTKTDYFEAASKEVAQRVRQESGLGPADVDAVQIYDNFTPMVLFSLEHFGFADRGEGWQFIRDGRIAIEGALPVNTSGGHTSEGYMQGWALEVEAVRQARGEAGDRQVADARTVQYICVSPVVSSHIFQRA
ncbi:thiolase family protein [Nesterenkonia suensis]